MTTWGAQAQRYWRHGWRLARQGGQQIRRTAARGGMKAREAGVKLAHKVISVQRAARMPEHLMQRSAGLTLGARKGPAPDLDWQAGYAAEAAKEGVLPDWIAVARPPEFQAGEREPEAS